MKRLLIIVILTILLLFAFQILSTITDDITPQVTSNPPKGPTSTPDPTPTSIPDATQVRAIDALDASIFDLPKTIVDNDTGSITIRSIKADYNSNEILIYFKFINNDNARRIFSITSVGINYCMVKTDYDILLEPKEEKIFSVKIPFVRLYKYDIQKISDVSITYRMLKYPVTTEITSGHYEFISSTPTQPAPILGNHLLYSDDNVDVYLNKVSVYEDVNDENFIFVINNKTDKAYEGLLQGVAVNNVCKGEEIYFYMSPNSTLILENPRRRYKEPQYFKSTDGAAQISISFSIRQLGQTKHTEYIITENYILDENIDVVMPEPSGELIYDKNDIKIYAGEIEYLNMPSGSDYVLNLCFENNSDYTYRAGILDLKINSQTVSDNLYMVMLPNTVCFTPNIIETDDVEIKDDNKVYIRFTIEAFGESISFDRNFYFNSQCNNLQ